MVNITISFDDKALKDECIWNRAYIVDFDQLHVPIVDKMHRHKTIETNFKNVSAIPTALVFYNTTFIRSKENQNFNFKL